MSKSKKNAVAKPVLETVEDEASEIDVETLVDDSLAGMPEPMPADLEPEAVEPDETSTEAPKKRGRKPAPEGENASGRFTRLGAARVSKIYHDLKLVANLSNRAAYTYNAAQVAKLFVAIRGRVDAAEAAFAGKAEEDTFTF